MPPSFSKSGNSISLGGRQGSDVVRGEKDFTQNAKEAGDQQSGTRSRTNRRASLAHSYLAVSQCLYGQPWPHSPAGGFRPF
jgi:hypothetical protein